VSQVIEENTKKTIDMILESPTVSFWLKGAIKQLLTRDPIDAWADAETLRAVMYMRSKEIQAKEGTLDNQNRG
jgi:hypothetical protein